MSTLSIASPGELARLESAVAGRLELVHGARVLDAGTLATRHVERDTGTPYVRIAAHSVLAADFAAIALRDFAGISDDEWESGWQLCGCDLVLRIYPEL